MSTRPPSLNDHRGPGERAAALAASWCTRRVSSAYGRSAWQLLADAARLGLVRHGRPEAWAAGVVIAVARVNGRLGTGRAVSAQQVADELEAKPRCPRCRRAAARSGAEPLELRDAAGSALRPRLIALHNCPPNNRRFPQLTWASRLRLRRDAGHKGTRSTAT